MGAPILSLCQIAAVMARMRCRTRVTTPSGVRPPCRSRSSWPLRVWLFDSMVWRSGLKNRASGRCGFAFACRSQQPQAFLGQRRLELFAEVALVADQSLVRALTYESGVRGEVVEQCLAFVGFRVGQRESDRETTQRAHKVQA